MLNPTELNEREGERGTAEPGREDGPMQPVTGDRSATMTSCWVLNHLCVIAGVWSMRHHHGTAAWDGGQAPTE